jgi:hypothetical protein
MTPSPESNCPDEDRQCYLDAIAGREFSLAQAIGQAGSGLMKGESPVPQLVQLKTELKIFTRQHLLDRSGALQAILQIWIDQADDAISRHLSQPLVALQDMVERLLEHPESLYELVHQVDFKWGQMYDEHPHFQQPGAPAHPDDEYSHDSVASQLRAFLGAIQSNLNP